MSARLCRKRIAGIADVISLPLAAEQHAIFKRQRLSAGISAFAAPGTIFFARPERRDENAGGRSRSARKTLLLWRRWATAARCRLCAHGRDAPQQYVSVATSPSIIKMPRRRRDVV